MLVRSEADPLLTRWSQLDRLSGSESREAWEWFARGYEPFVRRLLQLMGLRDVEEAVAEFWSYLFARRDGLSHADRGRRFRPFLTGFVRNFARERRRDVPAAVAVDADLPLPSEPACQETEAIELRLWAEAVVQRCLDEIESRKRHRGRVLRLFYGIADERGEHETPCTVSEVAEHLGLAISTVSPLLSEARGLLRQAIAAHLRETVTTHAELDEEVATLREALHGPYPGLTPPEPHHGGSET